jgi:hypothetical protein
MAGVSCNIIDANGRTVKYGHLINHKI